MRHIRPNIRVSLSWDNTAEFEPAHIQTRAGGPHLSPLFSMDCDMLADTLVVLDFETTGLRPDQGDRITEVAALRLHNGEVVARYESLVNCGRRLPHYIRAFTGISQAMVDVAPSPWLVFPELLCFIGDDPVVSHNAAFDQGFLDCECERLHLYRHGRDFLCTVQLARRLLPELASHSLKALARHFRLEPMAEHRAALDATVTVSVLLKLCELAQRTCPGRPIDLNYLRNLPAHHPSGEMPLPLLARSA